MCAPGESASGAFYSLLFVIVRSFISLNCVQTISNHETDSLKRARAWCNYSTWDSWTPPGRGPSVSKSWKKTVSLPPASCRCESRCYPYFGYVIFLTAPPLLPWLLFASYLTISNWIEPWDRESQNMTSGSCRPVMDTTKSPTHHLSPADNGLR